MATTTTTTTNKSIDYDEANHMPQSEFSHPLLLTFSALFYDCLVRGRGSVVSVSVPPKLPSPFVVCVRALQRKLRSHGSSRRSTIREWQ